MMPIITKLLLDQDDAFLLVCDFIKQLFRLVETYRSKKYYVIIQTPGCDIANKEMD